MSIQIRLRVESKKINGCQGIGQRSRAFVSDTGKSPSWGEAEQTIGSIGDPDCFYFAQVFFKNEKNFGKKVLLALFTSEC